MTHPKSFLCERQGRLDVIIVTAAASLFTPTAHLSKRQGDRWRDKRGSIHDGANGSEIQF